MKRNFVATFAATNCWVAIVKMYAFSGNLTMMVPSEESGHGFFWNWDLDHLAKYRKWTTNNVFGYKPNWTNPVTNTQRCALDCWTTAT